MTRRTPFNGTAASRRREARKHLQTTENKAWDAPVEQRVTLFRKATSRVDKALIARDTPVYDDMDNCCLPQVSLFKAGYRKSENVTAR